MNDRRRPRTPAKPKPAPLAAGPVQLDDETRNALILFNARLAAQQDQERDKRRIDKAARAKDDAAARVRELDGDPKASAEDKAAAHGAYLAALESWNRAKAGEPEPPGADTAHPDETDEHDEPADDEHDEPAADEHDEPAANEADQPDEPAAAESDEADEPDEPAAADAAEADEPATEPEPLARDDDPPAEPTHEEPTPDEVAPEEVAPEEVAAEEA